MLLCGVILSTSVSACDPTAQMKRTHLMPPGPPSLSHPSTPMLSLHAGNHGPVCPSSPCLLPFASCPFLWGVCVLAYGRSWPEISLSEPLHSLNGLTRVLVLFCLFVTQLIEAFQTIFLKMFYSAYLVVFTEQPHQDIWSTVLVETEVILRRFKHVSPLVRF